MAQNGRILLIDDDPDFSASLEQLLLLEDYVLEVFRSPEQALAQVTPEFAGIVLADVAFRQMPGPTLLDRLKSTANPPPLLLLSGPESIADAERLYHAGAFGVLSKPIQIESLLEKVGKALQTLPLAQTPLEPAPEQTAPTGQPSAGADSASEASPQPKPDVSDLQFLGKSKPITAIREQLEAISERGSDFLCLGEQGTGKEYLAQCVASVSDRALGPFVSVDCAKLSSTNPEVELFGDSDTLFAPPNTDRDSHLDRARGGFLYLRNIEALPQQAQEALMVLINGRHALLEAGMGAGALDFRLVAGSTSDLAQLTKEGMFDAELFKHIRAITITLPPVRKRGVDALILFNHFLNQAQNDFSLPESDVSASLTRYIISHNWPGNVAEIRTSAKTYAASASRAIKENQAAPEPLDQVDGAIDKEDEPQKLKSRSVIEFRKILGN
jgi:two-component system C4-dicarboxylate transport response regulator DctD